jgi:hypothetical protein
MLALLCFGKRSQAKTAGLVRDALLLLAPLLDGCKEERRGGAGCGLLAKRTLGALGGYKASFGLLRSRAGAGGVGGREIGAKQGARTPTLIDFSKQARSTWAVA